MAITIDRIAPPLLDSVPLSRLNNNASDVSERMQHGPIQVMKSSSTYGVLVSRDYWNMISEAMSRFNDMQELIELLKLEIDRLEEGRPESEPFDIDELERIARRVSA